MAVATPGLLTQFVQCVVSSFITNLYMSHVVLFAQHNTVLYIFRKRRPINCASCSDEGLCCSLLSDWVAQTLPPSDRDTSASSWPDNPTHGPSQTAPKLKMADQTSDCIHVFGTLLHIDWNSDLDFCIICQKEVHPHNLDLQASPTQDAEYCMQVRQPGITHQKHSSLQLSGGHICGVVGVLAYLHWDGCDTLNISQTLFAAKWQNLEVLFLMDEYQGVICPKHWLFQ